MTILAIDTALEACQAAVFLPESGRVLRRSETMQRGHGERLPVMVRELFAEAGIGPRDLTRIAVTRGPGTFTGIRIGLAMARGMGLGLGIPVLGFDTLEAIALGEVAGGAAFVVTLPARGEEIYAAVFHGDLSVSMAPHVTRAAALPPLRRVDSGLPEVARMAQAAARRPLPANPPEPLYLRAADVKPQADLKRTLRSAGRAEAAVLAAIHAECFASSWDATAIAALMATPGAQALLAIEGAEPAGFILTRQAADETEVLTLAVRPVFRRRGLGRALLASLSPLQHLFIEVAEGNSGAIALYRSIGLADAGRRAGYYARPGAPPEAAIVMRREKHR